MSRTVLILEDAVFIRAMEKKYLTSNNFEIAGETNSEDEGISMFKSLNPDLVIIDLKLAEGTGMGAIQRIKEINPRAKMLVITSYGEDLKKNAEISRQVSGILLKPFSEEEFIDKINGIVAG